MMKSEKNYGILTTPIIAVAMLVGSGLFMVTLWVGYLAISGLWGWL